MKQYSVCWCITSKCNLDCKFCFKKNCKDKSLQENLKILEKILQLNLKKLTISGGEPVLYKGFKDLIKCIKEKCPDLELNIITNATCLNAELIDFLVKNFHKITFSLDSVSKEKLSMFGRGECYLEQLSNALRLVENKTKIKINTVATKQNIDDLKDIFNWLLQFKINEWKILKYYPLRKGEEHRNIFLLNDFDSQCLDEIIVALKKNAPFEINFDNEDGIATNNFNVYPDGSVENCIDEDAGNLTYQSINEVLKQKYQDDMRYQIAIEVATGRSTPKREIDQIYMDNRSMVLQAKKCYRYLNNKDCVFLGDGDGASIYYALLQKYNLEKPINSITVLDIDDEILKYHKNLLNENNLEKVIKCDYIKYDVRNVLPQDLYNKFDFFYINPPYSSKNEGESIKVWLYRCFDLIKENGEGCIIIPTDKNYPWSIKNTKIIEEFLKEFGFEITKSFIDVHSYHLDVPLKSSTYIVKRTKFVKSPYFNKPITKEIVENLY